jgi:hypothetical protein
MLEILEVIKQIFMSKKSFVKIYLIYDQWIARTLYDQIVWQKVWQKKTLSEAMLCKTFIILIAIKTLSSFDHSSNYKHCECITSSL